MKILTLLQTALFALCVAGTAQASNSPHGQARAAAPAHVMELENTHCETNGVPADCNIAVSKSSNYDQAPAAAKPKPAQVDVAAAPVPEPRTFVMMMLGLVLLGVASSRREVYDKFSA